MNKDHLKKAFHNIIFFLLLILALVYLPSQIGMNFFCMAMLACPIKAIRRVVDYVLEVCSGRITWYLILLIFMGCYPLKDFGIIGVRIRYILDMLSSLIK